MSDKCIYYVKGFAWDSKDGAGFVVWRPNVRMLVVWKSFLFEFSISDAEL